MVATYKATALPFLPPLTSQYSPDPYQLAQNLTGWSGQLSNWSMRVSVLMNTLLQAGGVIGNGTLLVGDAGTGKFDLGGLVGGANITITNLPGGISIAVSGPFSPSTFTAHSVLVGEGAAPIVGVGPGVLGKPLIGQGAGADPIFGTLPVVGGGTNLTSGTAGGVPFFQTSSTMASSGALASNALVAGGGASGPATFAAFTFLSTSLLAFNLNAAAPPAASGGTILQIGNADGVVSGIELDAAANNNQLLGVRSEGTFAIPTATGANQVILLLRAAGYANGAYTLGKGSIALKSKTNTWTATDNGTQVEITTTPDASLTPLLVARFKNEGCQFQGTTTNDAAASGFYGEYLSAIALIASEVNVPSATSTDIITASIPAGDWDISAELWWDTATGGGVTGVTSLQAWLSTNSATLPTVPSDNTSRTTHFYALATPSVSGPVFPVGPVRMSFAGNTNVFLSARAAFTSANGTLHAYGIIRARRVR